MQIDAKVNTKEVLKAFRLAPKKLKWEFRDAFDHIQRSFLKKFRLERLQGPPGIRGGGVEGKGPGIFNRFKRIKLRSGDLEGMGILIYTESRIARIHEYGATITATSGKLAVPFSREIRPEMYSATGRLKARFRKPGQLKKVGLIESKGKELLVRFLRGGKELRPLYILKHGVKIKPRLGFALTAAAHRPRQIEILNRAVIKALNKV